MEQLFEHMCRACMCKDQNFHSIFDDVDKPLKICEMLATTIPQLLILGADHLPKLICVPCLNKLNISYQFQKMCIASDKQMRSLLLSGLVKNLSNHMGHQTETTQVAPSLEENSMGVDDLLKLQSCMKIEINAEEEEYNLEPFLEARTAKSEKDLDEPDEEWHVDNEMSTERSASDDR